MTGAFFARNSRVNRGGPNDTNSNKTNKKYCSIQDKWSQCVALEHVGSWVWILSNVAATRISSQMIALTMWCFRQTLFISAQWTLTFVQPHVRAHVRPFPSAARTKRHNGFKKSSRALSVYLPAVWRRAFVREGAGSGTAGKEVRHNYNEEYRRQSLIRKIYFTSHLNS